MFVWLRLMCFGWLQSAPGSAAYRTRLPGAPHPNLLSRDIHRRSSKLHIQSSKDSPPPQHSDNHIFCLARPYPPSFRALRLVYLVVARDGACALNAFPLRATTIPREQEHAPLLAPARPGTRDEGLAVNPSNIGHLRSSCLATRSRWFQIRRLSDGAFVSSIGCGRPTRFIFGVQT